MIELGQRIAEIGPTPDRSRITSQCVAVALDRVDVPVHRREHDAARVPQFRTVGIAGDCVAQQRFGAGMIAGVTQRPRPRECVMRARSGVGGYGRCRIERASFHIPCSGTPPRPCRLSRRLDFDTAVGHPGSRL
jgi:hypothetical protein